MEWFQEVSDALYKSLIVKDRYQFILEGLKNSLILAFLAVIIGIAIGTLVAIIKVTAANNKKMKPLGFVCDIYIGIIRGTPVYVQLLIMYFCIFASARIDAMYVGALTFGINSGAYVAEIIRAGILSIDKGQMEAGRSLGLPYPTVMKSIIMPQAIKNILPALGNEFIVLIKETAIVGTVTVYDLTKTAERISSATYDMLTPLLIVAAIYLVLVLGLTKLLNIFERRLARSDRG